MTVTVIKDDSGRGPKVKWQVAVICNFETVSKTARHPEREFKKTGIKVLCKIWMWKCKEMKRN